MDSLKSIDQLLAEGSLSYPQKESSKEKTKVQKPIANRPIGNSTIGRVSHVSSPSPTEVGQTEKVQGQKQMAIDQSPLARAERRAQSIKTLEIDEYLFGLVMEGLLSEDFMAYGAKCCYTLGLQRVNTIVLQVRQADCSKEGQSKMKLLAWKLNGAMQLHFKKQFYLDQQAREQ